MFDDTLGLIDTEELKMLISNRNALEKFSNFDSYVDYFKYCKDEYYNSMDSYILSLMNDMYYKFIPKNFAVLINYFDYFVKGRYSSSKAYFSNPVVKRIHLIDHGDYRDVVIRFLASKRNSSYYKMLDNLKCEYEKMVKSNSRIDYDTLNDLMEFFSNSRLEDYSVSPDIIDYIFSKMLNDNMIDLHFDTNLFKYYFTEFTKNIISSENLTCKVRVENINQDDPNVFKRASYYLPPYNEIILNNSLFGKTMRENVEFFKIIFHEIDHCKNLTTTIKNYSNLVMAKDFAIKKEVGYKYYSDNYDVIQAESSAKLNANIKILHYFKRINPTYYNSISKKVFDEINTLKRNYHNNERIYDDYKKHVDVLFEQEVSLKDKKFYISIFPILKYEYFEDGSRKSPIDIILSKYTTDDVIDKKMCDSIVSKQVLLPYEIADCYDKSLILLNEYNKDFENDRKILYSRTLLNKLRQEFDTCDNVMVSNIECSIIKKFITNMLFINACFNTENDGDKISYLNNRLMDDKDILDDIVSYFKVYNSSRNIDIDLNNIISGYEEKGLHL